MEAPFDGLLAKERTGAREGDTREVKELLPSRVSFLRARFFLCPLPLLPSACYPPCLLRKLSAVRAIQLFAIEQPARPWPAD